LTIGGVRRLRSMIKSVDKQTPTAAAVRLASALRRIDLHVNRVKSPLIHGMQVSETALD